jgi:hypothetical protein
VVPVSVKPSEKKSSKDGLIGGLAGWNAGLVGWNPGLAGWNAGFAGWNPGLAGWNAGFDGWNAGLSGGSEAGSLTAGTGGATLAGANPDPIPDQDSY